MDDIYIEGSCRLLRVKPEHHVAVLFPARVGLDSGASTDLVRLENFEATAALAVPLPIVKGTDDGIPFEGSAVGQVSTEVWAAGIHLPGHTILATIDRQLPPQDRKRSHLADREFIAINRLVPAVGYGESGIRVITALA